MQAEDHHQDRVHHRRLAILTKHGNNPHHQGHQDPTVTVGAEEEVMGDHLPTFKMMMATTTAVTWIGKATDLQNFMNLPANDQTRPAKLVMIIGSKNSI